MVQIHGHTNFESSDHQKANCSLTYKIKFIHLKTEGIMKTLKLSMIVAILSVFLIGYANADTKPLPAKKVVKISLVKALEEPGLVNAMREQLSLAFIKVEPNGLYVATVYYNRVIYKIYGTRGEWVKFFLSTSKKGIFGNANNGTQ